MQKLLDEIRTVKRAHLEWLQRTKFLIEGIPVKSSDVMHVPECDLGIWLHHDALNLLKYPLLKELIEKLQAEHRRLRQIYETLYERYAQKGEDEPKEGFIKSFFSLGIKKEMLQSSEAVNRDFHPLLESAQKLSQLLDQLIGKARLIDQEFLVKTGSHTSMKS